MEFLHPAEVMISREVIVEMTEADQEDSNNEGAKKGPYKDEKHTKLDLVIEN
ncbi:hypothetical protein SAMN02745746_03951 [Pseudogulbenkiania subflava DSM 22618]|uniref:Uncharacterized protein n=1 Tax=Pseudogulbenkiania subflava DSM 22618 TaxID=1123014 RepID=A0A1Y6CC67_9NEIS|nr:hypothetical protein SAMN02745746_03951 [Pseudogulbenkiania subflava DSM 22618]